MKFKLNLHLSKSAKLFIDEFIPAAAAWQMLGQALLVSNEMMFVD